jgi:hypothetical protein
MSDCTPVMPPDNACRPPSAIASPSPFPKNNALDRIVTKAAKPGIGIRPHFAVRALQIAKPDTAVEMSGIVQGYGFKPQRRSKYECPSPGKICPAKSP